MRSTGGGPLPRRTLKPAQHWDWPSPTPYSQGLRCGPWLFVGGQAALDEDGNVVGAGNRAEQTELVIRYVAHVLGAAGACFDDVLKLNTYYCRSVGAGALHGGAEARRRRWACDSHAPAGWQEFLVRPTTLRPQSSAIDRRRPNMLSCLPARNRVTSAAICLLSHRQITPTTSQSTGCSTYPSRSRARRLWRRWTRRR